MSNCLSRPAALGITTAAAVLLGLAATPASAQTNFYTGQNAGNGSTGQDQIAFGNRAGVGVSADRNISFGTDATASEDDSVAIATNSTASATGAVALGSGATASAERSVALGAGSVADQADTISVGAVGSERRIVNVANGVGATDAVNVRQLNESAAQTLSQAYDYTDMRLAAFDEIYGRRLDGVEQRLDDVGAMSAAFASMAGNSAGRGAGLQNRLVVGVGGFGDSAAMAVGYSRDFDDRRSFSIGVSSAGGKVMGGGSFGFAW